MWRKFDLKSDRYKVISEFECYGKNMVVIKIRGNVHIMSQEELQWVFGQSHPWRWKKVS